MLRWFDMAGVDALTERVVAEVRKATGAAAGQPGAASARKRQEAEARMLRAVDDARRQHRFNILQKARFGLRLQDALQAAGCEPAFSKQLSHALVQRMAQPLDTRQP